MIWKKMILLTVLAVLSAVGSDGSPVTESKNTRSGKFMRFGTADDVFSDVLDDMQDPLSAPEAIGLETVTDRLKDSVHHVNPATYHIQIQNDTNDDPVTTDEKIALYNQNTGKFELITSTSGHFMLPMKPVTENGVFVYGGQHYQYRKPTEDPTNTGNRTGEIKIFWSSVTDAIENLPFLPVQVNVPDMISAMANFLSTSIPIINRFTNPNHPRIPGRRPDTRPSPIDPYKKYQYVSNMLYDHQVEDRELKNGIKLTERKSNKRKGQRRKNNKRKNAKGTVKGIVPRPFSKRTTEPPTSGDTKIWHQFGSSEPGSLKNMPITRKKFHVTDREVFNFKNSDISNSPIMILNIPERPMMYYKTNIRQKLGDGGSGGGTENHIAGPPTIPVNLSPKTKPRDEGRMNSKKTTTQAAKRVRNTSGNRQKTSGSAEKGKGN